MKSFEFNHAKNISTARREGKLVDGEMITNELFGDSADITRLVMQFGDHTKSFVLKDYNQKSDWNSTAKEAAVHSMAVWERIKDLNLPTYTTYRIENDGTALLMTDLEKNGYLALSSNHATPNWYNEDGVIEKRVRKIVNFTDLLNEVKACVEKTISAGIVLEPDAYFLLVKEVTPGSFEAKIFIGDFEGVYIPENESKPSLYDPDDASKMSVQEARVEALAMAAETLEDFVRRYMPSDIGKNYIKTIKSEFDEVE